MKKHHHALPVVRAVHQFGPMTKHPQSVRLFLDDARNPPLHERDWVVVRTVKDGLDFLSRYPQRVREISLDNDLGPDPQGWQLLWYVLTMTDRYPHRFGQLRTITIHTGNMPKWRLMVRMCRGYPFKVKRIVPCDRIYPRSSDDKRVVVPWTSD